MTKPLAGLHIGMLASSASRAGGGVFEVMVRQAELVRAHGGRVSIFALRDEFSEADAERFPGCDLVHADIRGLRQFGYAPDLVPALLKADLDLLHLHGIWMYPSRAGTVWARRTGRGYLVSPHGMLDPWIVSRGTIKKAAARLVYERASWARADQLHALTASEAADLKRESGRDDALVIPNPAPEIDAGRQSDREPVVAYIGRIHAKKNLLALVEAWTQARLPADARLILAGWGEDADVAALTAAVADAGPAVSFIGPVYGEEKQRLLARARFVALPSLSEGLPMAVLESWAAATPTIMTAACNLPEGFSSGAAIACGTSAGEIAGTLELALACEQGQWQTMSDAARDLAATTFSLENVAQQWIAAYRGLARDERGVAG